MQHLNKNVTPWSPQVKMLFILQVKKSIWHRIRSCIFTKGRIRSGRNSKALSGGLVLSRFPADVLNYPTWLGSHCPPRNHIYWLKVKDPRAKHRPTTRWLDIRDFRLLFLSFDLKNLSIDLDLQFFVWWDLNNLSRSISIDVSSRPSCSAKWKQCEAWHACNIGKWLFWTKTSQILLRKLFVGFCGDRTEFEDALMSEGESSCNSIDLPLQCPVPDKTSAPKRLGFEKEPSWKVWLLIDG